MMQRWPLGEEIRYDGTAHPLVKALPHYHMVPKDQVGHLKWRLELRRKCQTSATWRSKVREMCENDPLWFINSFCIAEGTLVVTDRGAVPIESVSPHDLVWDGESWVSQKGPVFQGTKYVVESYGVHLTPDHKVWTVYGWQRADSGYDRAPVRPPSRPEIQRTIREDKAGGVALHLRVRKGDGCLGEPTQEGPQKELRLSQGGTTTETRSNRLASVCGMDGNARQVQESQQSVVSPIWSAWNSRLRSVEGIFSLPGGYGGEAGRNDDRAKRQRWGLLPRELPVGKQEGAGQQYSQEPLHRNFHRAADAQGSLQDCGYYAGGDVPEKEEREDWRQPNRATPAGKSRVYDLINCGPRRAFTVIDRDGNLLLVHNCFLIEPRGTGRIPFNTWPHQDVWLAATAHYSGWAEKELQRDQILRKSRAQGATWGIAAEYVRAFLFRRACIQGFVSKDEDTADNPSNPNSFGWKIDFILRNLPPWMVGDFERKSSDHTWRLVARENYLMGAAATGAGFRGGRLWRAFMDESAFWLPGQDAAFVENLRAVTDCRIIASTPNGQNNKFYDLVHSPSSWLNLILHWQDNPDQNEGLYTTENGKLKILEGEAKPNYPYVLDGRVRSFWYDAECQRSGGNMIEISRELDIDFGGSKGRPFSAAVVNKHKATCCTPMHRGDLLLKDPADLHESEWVDQEAGPITMWVPITNGRPPRGSRVVGCDISAGTAGDLSSNSVAIIFDAITREQIAEVVRNDLPGAEFADYVAAVCYWFGWDGTNPYLIWEKNGGAGSLFTKRMMNIQYPNMYFQPSKDDDRLYAKTGDRPGYHNSNKYITISPLILAMTHGTVTLKSIHLVTECGEYVYVEGASSKIEHPKSRTGFDASAQGENHGDRAIAAAVAVRALDERPKAKRPESQWDQLGKAPDGSIGRRIYENALAKGDPISCEW